MNVEITEHNMGPMVDGEQRCTRCGLVLWSIRDVAYPTGEDPPGGFAEGVVTTFGLASRISGLTAGPTDGAVRCGEGA